MQESNVGIQRVTSGFYRSHCRKVLLLSVFIAKAK